MLRVNWELEHSCVGFRRSLELPTPVARCSRCGNLLGTWLVYLSPRIGRDLVGGVPSRRRSGQEPMPG